MEGLSEAAFDLLRELAVIPDCVGYDHRIRELDEHEPRLITWVSGHGYSASDAGRAAVASRLKED